MKLYQITVPKDDSQTVMNELGDLGKVQFLDLNVNESPLNLPFTADIRKIEESERKLQYLLEQCRKVNVDAKPPETIEGFLKQLKNISENKRKALNLLNDEIQQDIAAQEEFVRQQNEQIKQAEASLESQSDCLKVLEVAQRMLPGLQERMPT